MYTLTKEQKISNLEEHLQRLVVKKNNLETQISGIEEKIEKLKRAKSSTSKTTTWDSAISAMNP